MRKSLHEARLSDLSHTEAIKVTCAACGYVRFIRPSDVVGKMKPSDKILDIEFLAYHRGCRKRLRRAIVEIVQARG